MVCEEETTGSSVVASAGSEAVRGVGMLLVEIGLKQAEIKTRMADAHRKTEILVKIFILTFPTMNLCGSNVEPINLA